MKHRDPETLRSLYWDEGLSQREIAERLGSHPATIHKWMKRLEVPTRTANQEKPPSYETDYNGYTLWRTTISGEQNRVYVHRLLAVSEYGFDAVSDKVVHHKNECPFDNRPDNLEVMERGDHQTHHNLERGWYPTKPNQ